MVAVGTEGDSDGALVGSGVAEFAANVGSDAGPSAEEDVTDVSSGDAVGGAVARDDGGNSEGASISGAVASEPSNLRPKLTTSSSPSPISKHSDVPVSGFTALSAPGRTGPPSSFLCPLHARPNA